MRVKRVVLRSHAHGDWRLLGRFAAIMIALIVWSMDARASEPWQIKTKNLLINCAVVPGEKRLVALLHEWGGAAADREEQFRRHENVRTRVVSWDLVSRNVIAEHLMELRVVPHHALGEWSGKFYFAHNGDGTVDFRRTLDNHLGGTLSLVKLMDGLVENRRLRSSAAEVSDSHPHFGAHWAPGDRLLYVQPRFGMILSVELSTPPKARNVYYCESGCAVQGLLVGGSQDRIRIAVMCGRTPANSKSEWWLSLMSEDFTPLGRVKVPRETRVLALDRTGSRILSAYGRSVVVWQLVERELRPLQTWYVNEDLSSLVWIQGAAFFRTSGAASGQFSSDSRYVIVPVAGPRPVVYGFCLDYPLQRVSVTHQCQQLLGAVISPDDKYLVTMGRTGDMFTGVGTIQVRDWPEVIGRMAEGQ